MAKGNYTALQQLKPTELKVGEYYNSFVDDLIKRGDADRAARAKQIADQKKAIGERFGEFKTDPFSTISQLQDFSNESLVNTANYIGQQRILAEQDPANAYKYIQRAERAYNDHRTLAASFGSKDFIDKSTGKMEALANNDVFAATDNNAKLAFLTNAKPLVRRNEETGNMELYMPKNENATPEDPLEKYSVGQTVGLFTSPDEINLLRSNKSNGNNGFLDKQVFDIAKQMSDEYSRNYDGNRTNAKTWFSQDRGNLWFDSNFGAFNANKINPIVRQYSKDVNGKEIETEEDFLAAKKGIIDSVAALVGREETVKTEESALDIAIKNQRLVNERLEADAKRVAIRNAKNGGGSGSGSGGFSSVTDSMVNKQDKVIVQIQGNDGNVKGVQLWSANTVPLPKVKNFPATENTFGLSKFKNSKGQEVNTIIMGAPADNGKIVYSKISGSDFSNYVSKAGYDPLVVLNKLGNENTVYNRYTGKVDSSKDVYNKVKVGYKAKEVRDEESGSGTASGFGNVPDYSKNTK